MNRKKEISIAANKEFSHSYKVEAFIKGATWADKNPARDPNEPRYEIPVEQSEAARLKQAVSDAKEVMKEFVSTLVPYSPISDEGIAVKACEDWLSRHGGGDAVSD